MNSNQKFAEILRRIAPLSEAERSEALLGYFASALQSLDTESLLRFRAYCAMRDEGTDAEATMLEIIDGQLALRELAGADR